MSAEPYTLFVDDLGVVSAPRTSLTRLSRASRAGPANWQGLVHLEGERRGYVLVFDDERLVARFGVDERSAGFHALRFAFWVTA